MAINAVSAGRQIGGPRNAAGIDVEMYKNCYDWFVIASTSDGQQCICTKQSFEEVFRGNILGGRLKTGKPVRLCSKRGAIWEESTPSLYDFAQKHPKLRALYQPIHTRAVTGYWRGFVAGMALAMLNAIIVYAIADPWVAVCLGAAVLATFIPRIGQNIALVPFGLLGLTGRFAPVLGTLASLTAFGVLGGLTGMAIGGGIAWTWEDKLPRAPDAPAEASAALMSVLLPLIASLLLWSVFILIVYPWAMHIVGSPSTWRTQLPR